MAGEASRARKIEWLGIAASWRLQKAVSRIISRRGVDFLTDEQIDELVRQEIADTRVQRQMNRRNRERAAGRL